MNDRDLLRYSRHIFLPEMDIEGQQKLLDCHILIIGLGGLGSPVVQYLAASGVGNLYLVDHDVVELSNVQRQICHGTNDVGKTKVQSAVEEIERGLSKKQIPNYYSSFYPRWIWWWTAVITLIFAIQLTMLALNINYLGFREQRLLCKDR
jgi:molybdopterin/thiamine biosynthesis adenylyltransferase